MFIAELFTIAKIWEQPKCPSVDEWIKQLWDIYTMEYYSAIKKEAWVLTFMVLQETKALGAHEGGSWETRLPGSARTWEGQHFQWNRLEKPWSTDTEVV